MKSQIKKKQKFLNSQVSSPEFSRLWSTSGISRPENFKFQFQDSYNHNNAIMPHISTEAWTLHEIAIQSQDFCNTSLSVSARYSSFAEHLNSSVAVRLLQGIFTPAGCWTSFDVGGLPVDIFMLCISGNDCTYMQQMKNNLLSKLTI